MTTYIVTGVIVGAVILALYINRKYRNGMREDFGEY